jgi:hypothetical protein
MALYMDITMLDVEITMLDGNNVCLLIDKFVSILKRGHSMLSSLKQIQYLHKKHLSFEQLVEKLRKLI